ncbi:MAG: hypothetical protein RLZZ301_879 [Bacteroidota bacterium]|jgi:uncharacterized protein (DUF1800 family)
MTPYSGPWTKNEAAHLLRRCTFGATFTEINQVASVGLAGALQQLLSNPVVDQPLAYDTAETIVPFGTTWVNAVYPTNVTLNQQVEGARMKSLGAWVAKNLNQESLTIAEKMVFFWQNHFGVTTSGDARAMYQFLNLLRTHALGNVKQLVKDVTIDPCMLLFLNGASNNVYAPNENYGRELLELFTIGKGPQLATGDYTTYTEQDVAAGAKILTGYTVSGVRSDVQPQVSAAFMPILHDTTSKTLSAHFSNQSIAPNGATEYADYIDVIFARPETAVFICTKLYRYFVNYDITPSVASDIIPAMAQTLISANYELMPVLQQLFGSAHFYDSALRGSNIRNPLELICGLLNPTQTSANFDLATNYQIYLSMYYFADTMGQAYGAPPSVAGWTAYYQAPSYSKLWINSTYIKKRFDAINALVYGGLVVNGNTFKLDLLSLLNGLSDPSNAPQVIEDLCLVFFPKDIAAADKLVLKSLLTGGLPDFEWTIQYNDYLAAPTNTSLSGSVLQRMQALTNVLFKMPQYQVI